MIDVSEEDVEEGGMGAAGAAQAGADKEVDVQEVPSHHVHAEVDSSDDEVRGWGRGRGNPNPNPLLTPNPYTNLNPNPHLEQRCGGVAGVSEAEHVDTSRSSEQRVE